MEIPLCEGVHILKALVRSLAQFVAAIVLFALILCAVEVGVRALRLKHRLEQTASHQTIELTQPSSSTYVDVTPLLNQSVRTREGERHLVATNELGMRSGTVTIPKPRGTYRILVLGADDTFGVGVDQSQTFSAQLAQIIAANTEFQVEVLNAGCPRAGPLVSLLRLRQRFLALQPDLVVWNLCLEDPLFDRSVRGTLRVDETGQPAYAVHPKFKAKGSGLLDGVCEEFVVADWSLGQAQTLIGLNPGAQSVKGDPSEMPIGQTAVQMQRLVNEVYGKLLISLQPSGWLMKSGTHGLEQSQQLLQEIRQSLADAGNESAVIIHNSVGIFSQSGQMLDVFSAQTGRLLKDGHLLHARALAQTVFQNVPAIRSDAMSQQAPIGQPRVSAPSQPGQLQRIPEGLTPIPSAGRTVRPRPEMTSPHSPVADGLRPSISPR